ncbi:MAG: hypothetical protein K0V04_20525 [Deltaproteobacteria bacterium]|nr:hypothetical protein [Deltaproteobacteria bacterium]
MVISSAVACENKGDPATAETDPTTDGGIDTLPTAGTSADGSTEGPASTAGSGGADSGATGPEPGTSADSTEGATTNGPTGGGGGFPVDCDGTIFACGDQQDNDGDGFIDLFDPECTGPCDDDESSFQTGIPGDNMDCRQDCFFDGNSGQGDDGCIWDLRCDPANPGAAIGCEYTGGNNCNNQPANQDPECIAACEPFVPPGCDCFGCCTVQTPNGPVNIFLNSSPDCSLDNLGACEECTIQIDDCGMPCLDLECQLCFGQSELPEGCDDNTCEIGDPCDDQPDCPNDYFCYLGCCYPPPQG